MLVLVPLAAPYSNYSGPQISIQNGLDDVNRASPSQALNAQTGTLNPVHVEHFGATSGIQPYLIGRTDTEPTPGSEVFSPAGAQGNMHSADCSGGHFQVGAGGSADFGSSQGTISLWIKWDVTAPHGRFWGQDGNFETRWSSNRLTLDWGSDTTFMGTKNDWVHGQWYFFAITWDENSNNLAIYWGDEDTEPVDDGFTSSWIDSVVGLHTENDIMNSAGRASAQIDGHVDDFRYYSVQRTLEDLRSDYRVTLIGSELGLSHYYQFEEDLSDSSGAEDLIPVGSYSFNHDVYSVEGAWRAEQVELNIRNLDLLYVLNGTFETGNPGANVDWSGDGIYYADGWFAQREVLNYSGRQRASYIETESKYIAVENEGFEVTGPNGYRHYNGTSIYWYQIVNNSLQQDDFEFNMDYLYQRGPIGTNYSNIFEFSFEVLNGTSVLWNWSIDPTNITQRGIWYSTNSIAINIPDAPSIFEVRISLKVNTTSTYVQISEMDSDLDGDSANGMFVTFFVDDISFTALDAPSLQKVNLSVKLEKVGTIPILGDSGQGFIWLNYSYWEKASIPFTFSTNTTVSFEYSSRISKMTRFCSSTNSTHLDNDGVAYSVELGHSAELSFYTYIPSYPEATDIGITVHYPSDWSTPRVEDPFGQNMTDEAVIGTDQLVIPSGIADSAGWWKFVLNGPNYADSVSTQVLTPSGLTWNSESTFHGGNRIRCRASIRTGPETLPNVTGVEINWYDPTGGIWKNEVFSNPNSSIVISQGATLGSNNASIGEWMVSISWSNGSEVAYDCATFELFHRLTVFAQTPNIEVESGDGFTAVVYLYDQDNGNPILSDADMIGNWSTNEVQFNPNLAKGWWEADFNTTHLGNGDFVIVVEVSIPFFETSSTMISVRVPSAESLFELSFRAGVIGALVVMVSVAVVTLSRRFYMITTAKRNLELLVLESRIDDAKNLIGLLVIHRSIGLPVYSNILKGGFQEALLSSFISAISNFRSEFSMGEPTWTAIPITEVITAVQTEALICAIITVEQASNRQKTQLEAFGREVGGLYDHEDDTMRTMVRTPTLNGTFTSIFESYFDGYLMSRYVGVKKNLPKHLHAVSNALDTMEIDHGVSVEAIIKATSILGYSERRAHSMVLEAVDSGYLIAAEKKLPSPIKTED
jgi:hypothetical protein